jgi:hypothetical protein
VGKAQEVIQGIYPSGGDLDTTFIFNCMEFAEEEDEPGTPPIVAETP